MTTKLPQRPLDIARAYINLENPQPYEQFIAETDLPFSEQTYVALINYLKFQKTNQACPSLISGMEKYTSFLLNNTQGGYEKDQKNITLLLLGNTLEQQKTACSY